MNDKHTVATLGDFRRESAATGKPLPFSIPFIETLADDVPVAVLRQMEWVANV